jgi:hypothetical protein
MYRQSIMLTLLACIISLTACVPQSRVIQTQQTIIVTPAPVVRQIVVPPSGYVGCRISRDGFYDGMWVPGHQICRYSNLPGRVEWVSGYWACTEYNLDTGACGYWDWRSPRWSNQVVVY